jgi:hypothetical protein
VHTPNGNVIMHYAYKENVNIMYIMHLTMTMALDKGRVMYNIHMHNCKCSQHVQLTGKFLRLTDPSVSKRQKEK